MKNEPWCLRYFTYDHLPEGKLRECSRMFAEAAHDIVLEQESLTLLYKEMLRLPSNRESSEALDKIGVAAGRLCEGQINSGMRFLLEAKDCAVRSLLEVSNDETD